MNARGTSALSAGVLNRIETAHLDLLRCLDAGHAAWRGSQRPVGRTPRRPSRRLGAWRWPVCGPAAVPGQVTLAAFPVSILTSSSSRPQARSANASSALRISGTATLTARCAIPRRTSGRRTSGIGNGARSAFRHRVWSAHRRPLASIVHRSVGRVSDLLMRQPGPRSNSWARGDAVRGRVNVGRSGAGFESE